MVLMVGTWAPFTALGVQHASYSWGLKVPCCFIAAAVLPGACMVHCIGAVAGAWPLQRALCTPPNACTGCKKVHNTKRANQEH